MGKFRPFMAELCLIAMLATAGCSSGNGGDAPASDSGASSGRQGTEESNTSSFSQGGGSAPTDASTASNPANEPSATDTAAVDPNPPSIDGMGDLTVDRQYRLRLLLGGQSVDFRTALPSGDLTGRESELVSSSPVKASVACENSNCSVSNVSLKYGSHHARLQLRNFKMKALAGELQKACQVPLFFDYEVDTLIGATSVLRHAIKQYQRIDSVQATLSRTRDWSDQEFESIHVELYANNSDVLSLNDLRRSRSQNMRATSSRIPMAQNFSYGIVGEGESMSIDFIKFHFPTATPSGEELCYHLPLVPETLAL